MHVQCWVINLSFHHLMEYWCNKKKKENSRKTYTIWHKYQWHNDNSAHVVAAMQMIFSKFGPFSNYLFSITQTFSRPTCFQNKQLISIEVPFSSAHPSSFREVCTLNMTDLGGWPPKNIPCIHNPCIPHPAIPPRPCSKISAALNYIKKKGRKWKTTTPGSIYKSGYKERVGSLLCASSRSRRTSFPFS